MFDLTRRGAIALGATAFLSTAFSNQFAVSAINSSNVTILGNTYPWATFARREGRKLVLHSDELMAQMAASGLEGYEPIIERPDEFDGLVARLSAYGLVM